MTKFQIVSDLHIEYKNNKFHDPLDLITPVAPILIMAGDIGNFYKYEQLKDYMEKVCEMFDAVIYVPGNSEYYQVVDQKPLSMKILFERMLKINENIKNLHILNRDSVRINNVCITGCTLWSKPEVTLPKFIVRIKDMYTSKYANLHNKDKKYIKKMIKYCNSRDLKLLVVTHHCPSFQVIPVKKDSDKYISLYASNMDYMLDNKYIHTWIAGHIHINFDLITENGTRLVGNQYGKPKDNIKDFKKNMVIDV
jgi:predicted phosphohydrolase